MMWGLRLLSALAVAGVLAGQLGRWFPDADPLNALLGPLLVLLALLLAVALRWGKRTTAAMCGLGLIVAGVQLGSAIPRQTAARQDAAALRILTLSTFHANPAPEAIRDVVKAAAPDIAVFQETDGTPGPVVDSLLPGYFRVKSCKWKRCSLTIVSRWPAQRIHIPARKGEKLPDVLVVEVQAPFGRFRVLGVHLPRPYYSSAPKFHKDLIAAASRLRDLPLLVAGDFNTPTGSFGLNTFARRTGLRPVEGYIPTYPANQPIPAFVAIDHIFADARWGVAACQRTAAGNSDHFGVLCDLKSPAPGN